MEQVHPRRGIEHQGHQSLFTMLSRHGESRLIMQEFVMLDMLFIYVAMTNNYVSNKNNDCPSLQTGDHQLLPFPAVSILIIYPSMSK